MGGLIAALFAKSFEQVYGLRDFFFTPLMYFGGIFIPLAMLPDWARGLTRANPMFYVLNAFRYAVLGVSDVPFAVAVSVTVTAGLILFAAAIALMKRGTGIRE
jgi:ABC-2 type transport system permease protein